MGTDRDIDFEELDMYVKEFQEIYNLSEEKALEFAIQFQRNRIIEEAIFGSDGIIDKIDLIIDNLKEINNRSGY